jgi:hypothetical protein
MVPWCSSFLGCFLCAFGDCMIACICRAQMGSIDCGFMMICGYCWYIYIYELIFMNIHDDSWWFMAIHAWGKPQPAGPEAGRRWTREELAQSRLAGSWLLAVEGFVYDVSLFATWMRVFWGTFTAEADTWWY